MFQSMSGNNQMKMSTAGTITSVIKIMSKELMSEAVESEASSHLQPNRLACRASCRKLQKARLCQVGDKALFSRHRKP